MQVKNTVPQPHAKHSLSRLSSKPRSFIAAHKRGLYVGVVLVTLWLIASFLFYRRYPDYMQTPNFYAEDGQVFAKNILLHGFWHSLFTTFNGYYVWGIYILQKVGFVINSLVYNGQLITLPKALALTSYGFLGFMVTMPLLLFRKYLPPVTLLFIFLLTLFVPLIGSDYTLIGTIGTFKFCFVYVAFLLLVYRHLIPEQSSKFYFIDAGLLLCMYTNTTVYAMVPFALLRYWPLIHQRNFRGLFHARSFWSLFGLGVLALPQLYIIHRDGIPPLPGYLDSPFNFHRTIEIFVSRSYTYTILFPFNKHMNDVLAVLALVIFTVGAFWLSKRQRLLFAFAYISILLTTVLFVFKRPGVSAFFSGYVSGGPDQFFFAQNWIFAFAFALVLTSLVAKISSHKGRLVAYCVVIAGILFVLAPRAGTYGQNDFEQKSIGNIYQNAHEACLQKGKTVTLTVYPVKTETFSDIPRQDICTPAIVNYQPPLVDLGLMPGNNDYVAGLGTQNTVKQTFVSPRQDLDGLNIYFSTFAARVRSPYRLVLYSDSACKQVLRNVAIPVGSLQDNDFHLITFPVVHNSADQQYCFSVQSARSGSQSPLAIQLSPSNTYTAGTTLINGKTSDKDVVFGLHYKEAL